MFEYSKGQVVGLLISFFVIFLISVLLHIKLKNKSEKIKKIPQQVVTILIILSEIAKLISCLITKDYISIYPFYFCSFFWFWFLFADFGKTKFSQSCMAISFVGSLAMTILFLVNPSSIVGYSIDTGVFNSYLNFHHILFHSLVSLHLFLCISLSTYKPQKSHFVYILIWILVLCLIIIPGAYLTGVNFMNILSSNISFLEAIRIKNGQFVYDLFLVIWLAIALELLASVCYLIYKKFKQ